MEGCVSIYRQKHKEKGSFFHMVSINSLWKWRVICEYINKLSWHFINFGWSTSRSFLWKMPMLKSCYSKRRTRIKSRPFMVETWSLFLFKIHEPQIWLHYKGHFQHRKKTIYHLFDRKKLSIISSSVKCIVSALLYMGLSTVQVSIFFHRRA